MSWGKPKVHGQPGTPKTGERGTNPPTGMDRGEVAILSVRALLFARKVWRAVSDESVLATAFLGPHP